MAKISRIARTRMIAAKIMETMDAIGQRSMDAYRECERVENLSVPLADMIAKGLVTGVSDEMLGMMEDTLASLTVVVEHGLSLFLADIEENVTVIEYRHFDSAATQRGMVIGFSDDRVSVKVTDPNSLLATRNIWTSLLWAPRSTVIVS